MGYYIQTAVHTNKAEWLIEHYNAIEVSRPEKFSDIPRDTAIIVIVQNGSFDACGYAYDELEFARMGPRPGDYRPMRYLLMNKQVVENLIGVIPIRSLI